MNYVALLLALLLIPGALALDYAIVTTTDPATRDERAAIGLLDHLEDIGHEGGRVEDWADINPDTYADTAMITIHEGNAVGIFGESARAEYVIMGIDAQSYLLRDGIELKNIFHSEIDGRDLEEIHADVWGPDSTVPTLRTTTMTAYGCTDSDGGIAPTIIGSAQGENALLQDACNTDEQLYEAYCIGDAAQRKAVTCEWGCSGGACQPEPDCIPGNGSVTKGVVTYEDFCVGDSLHAYTCNRNAPQRTISECPGGCRDGRCIELVPAPEDLIITESAPRALGMPCGTSDDCQSGECDEVCIERPEEPEGLLERLIRVLSRLFG